MSEEEEAACAALQQELEDIEAVGAEADELTAEQDQRLGELEAAIEALNDRPVAFDTAEVARAGAFVSIAPDGALRVERGYVRPEDELPVEPEPKAEATSSADPGAEATAAHCEHRAASGESGNAPAPEPEEPDGLLPISDRLMTELTAHRTIALRHALGEDPGVAFLAALHVLCLKVFFHYAQDTCLELDLKSVGFGSQAPGLNDSASARALAERHRTWAASLPKEPGRLWDALQDWDGDSRQALFAHCVALSVNAVAEPCNRRPRALAHADTLAQAIDLDMAEAGWTPTVDNYLGRVTKARILQAVTEAKGGRAAERIAHLKKGDMAAEAETLLAGSGWVPEPLRTPGRALPGAVEPAAAEDGAEEVATEAGADGVGEADPIAASEEDGEATASEPEPAHALAAE